MIRKIMGVLLLLLTGAALAEDFPQPFTGDLTGAWAFAGGAEELGDGFRLNADGTGMWLEAADDAEYPLRTLTETGGGFAWEVVYGMDSTQLNVTETDDGIRTTYTYGVETYGDARIHIPNEVSGGFYYPLLDDAARAYLSAKDEPSAFDGVLADYLDGRLAEQVEAAGLPVDGLCLLQADGAWRIALVSYDEERELEVRFILDEAYVTVYADEWVSLWDDLDLGQPWFAPESAARYYAMLPGILESYLTWEYDPLPESEPESPALPELTAYVVDFPPDKRYAVYEVCQGDETANWRRAGSGKAVVSTNGDIRVYAQWKGRLLIDYEISFRQHRIGWISADVLSEDALTGVPELPSDGEDSVYGVVTADTLLTDDPLWSHNLLANVPAGTSVHVLASLDDRWLLARCFIDGELRMGFLFAETVALHQGWTENAVRVIDRATRYTEADVQSAMDAAAAFIEANFAGASLMEIRYVEAESADPAAWWQDETGALEGMLLYADLNSMALWEAEIAGQAVAEDYEFILYREPGGTWYVGNYGYS